MTTTRSTRLGSERGAVLIAGLLLTLALLIVLGAAVDIGHAFIIRRELVSLADDAALAGSQQLDPTAIHQGQLDLNPAQARQAALATLAGQQLTTAQASATANSVTVQIRRRFPTVLLRLVGLTTLTVSAQASAAPRAP
jgi:Flp pilus assembly protein TadG